MPKKIKTMTLETYEEKNLGLPYSLIIKNAVVAKIDADTDEILSTKVPNFEGLIGHFIMLRIQVANKFLGQEVRFFRKSLGMNSKSFAAMLNVNPSTLSRWEGGSIMNEKDERLLRIALGSIYAEAAPQVKFEPLRIMQIGLKAVFEKRYQPHFQFALVRPVEEAESEWQGFQEAA